MRILRLDLLAFGPFTNRSLDFGDGARLHIVHGLNEAGKSSALRALRCLLYGIPLRSPDNFVHSYSNMRIGAVVEAANGQRLEFIRRKGRTKTLRDANDSDVVDDARLLNLLGGVDEAMFSQRFGIDHEELRRGGESLVGGTGDLGEILFAAGAGVADLRRIHERLDAEADELFKPRGANQRITRAISDLDQARKDVRDALLSTSQWTEHDAALRKAEQRQEEIDQELSQKQTERSRLDRVHRSLPLIGQLGPLREKVAGLADARMLPDSFSADRRGAETSLANAKMDAAKARREIDRIENDLGGTDVPAGLLEHRTAITQLHKQLGGYQKAANDRPGLVAGRDQAQQEARKLLQELGRPLELAEAESLRLPKAERSRIQSLAADCRARVEKRQSCDAVVRQLAEELRVVQEELDQLPPEQDISELERAIRHVQKQGDLDAQLRKESRELEKLREQAVVEFARLPLFDGTFEELEQLAVPSAETIDRFEHELGESEQDIRRRNEKCDELTASIQALHGDLDALQLEGEVPTEADLEEARRRRNAGWELVRHAWQEETATDDSAAATEFIAELAADGDLASAFRASIDTADGIADRLRREADRVARKAKLTSDLQQAESRLADARSELDQAVQRGNGIRDEWQSLWEPIVIESRSPREMRAWRATQQQLAAMAGDIRVRQVDHDELSLRIDSLRSDLNQSLEALRQSRIPDSDALGVALDRCEEIAERVRDGNQRHEELVREQKRLIGRQPEAEQQADEARQELEQWRAAWTAAVAPLGLGGDAAPSDANAVIETVDELLGYLKEARKLDVRIAGIDADADAFKHSVRQLLQQVAPDLLDTFDDSVERSVGDLVDRVSRAEKDRARVDGWNEELRKRQVELDEAASLIANSEGEIEKLCEEAGCDSAADLPAAEEKSQSRRETATALQTLEQRLRELAAGTELDEWVAAAEEFDADRVQADVARLDGEIDALEREKKSVSEKIGEHRNELSRMDGSGKAADAQLRAEHHLASIRNDSEEYIRRRLASAVLSRAMERFRESNQGPALNRAAELFSTLTLGSFSGVRTDYDSSGKDVLVGVRPGGQTVPLAGMSEGTCDQLYLALRVALLESSLAGREPLPFVVDDLLVMFDDARAAAALEVLARLSESTQVIFFTHHQHLVDIAQETVGSGVLSVHRLDDAEVAVLS